MKLTATKRQAARLLNLSEDTVERLVHQGRLRRTEGVRSFRLTLESLAAYTGLPLEFVEKACREVGDQMEREDEEKIKQREARSELRSKYLTGGNARTVKKTRRKRFSRWPRAKKRQS